MDIIDVCQKIAKAGNKRVWYEVGIDKHSDECTNLIDFVEFLSHRFHPDIKFVGGNTGLCVHGRNNANNFNPSVGKRLVELCQERGLYYRQHNADYLVGDGWYKSHLSDIRSAEIPSVNIAPEYGVEETNKLLRTLSKYEFKKEREELRRIFYKSKKWKKWASRWTNNDELAIMAGHYMFEDQRVKEIKAKVETAIPLNKILKEHLREVLRRHLRICGWRV